ARLLQHGVPRTGRRPPPGGGARGAGRTAGGAPARLTAADVAARAPGGGRLGRTGRPRGLRAGPGPRPGVLRTRPRGGRPGVDDLLRRGRTGGPGGAVLVDAGRLAARRPARPPGGRAP